MPGEGFFFDFQGMTVYTSPFVKRNCFFFVSAVALSFLNGCTTPGNRTSVLEPPACVMVITDTTNPPPVETDTSNSLPLLAGEMLMLAKEYCRIGEFASADSIAREILAILGNSEARAVQEGDFPVDQHMNDIVTMYSEFMPESFPVPEGISSEVLHRKVFESLDSPALSAQDSMLIAGYLKQTGISSDIPLTWNSRVQKALLYYLTRNQSGIDNWKKWAPIYLPFMKKMFADSALPQDLAYLPLIESGFNPKAYSRAHASGIWQFIGSTGKLYGLRNNYWIDERRDPVRSTEAAISYLKKLYNDFGDWHLALAAYNCGENGLSRAMEKNGSSDYWKLQLPAETMNYVPFYLASLAIAKGPDFTAAVGSLGDTMPFDVVKVGECIDMREIAKVTGIDYDTLKKNNPHILRWCTPPDMTNVNLYLPPGFAPAFNTFYESLPDAKKVRWYRYRVQPGDNLGSIAKRFQMPIEGIKSVNRLQGARIIAGKYLFIPLPVNASAFKSIQEEDETEHNERADAVADVPEGAQLTIYEVRPGDTVWRLAEIFGVSADRICAWNRLADVRIKAGQILSIYTVNGRGNGPSRQTPSSSPSSDYGQYIVRENDNLFRIARRFSMSLDELCSLNGISIDKPVIHPGDTLLVATPPESAMGCPVQDAGRRTPLQQPPGTIAYIVSPGDNLFRIAQNFSTSVAQIRKLNGLSGSSVIRCGDTLFVPKPFPADAAKNNVSMKEIVYYTVKSGDNLWRIANALGVSVERLCEYNNLNSRSVLLPGDTLRIVREGEM